MDLRTIWDIVMETNGLFVKEYVKPLFWAIKFRNCSNKRKIRKQTTKRYVRILVHSFIHSVDVRQVHGPSKASFPKVRSSASSSNTHYLSFT
jgi:hypothetical protein